LTTLSAGIKKNDMLNQQNKNLKIFPSISPGETHIYVNNNQIESIPSSIGNYPTLLRLYITANKIKELPVEIGKLKQLQLLLLGNNQISKLPVEIGQLTNLTQLRLENNKLTELPKEIGNLTNLTHLFLENNQISSLPEEIKNLTKLLHLSLDGNPIALPEGYIKTKPQESISFILEQGELEIKDSLITRKAYFFVNASKSSVEQKYLSLLDKFSTEKQVMFDAVQSVKDINPDTNIVFIIAPLDIHKNERLIFDIASNCTKLDIRFFIFIQKGFIEKDFDSVNLTKGDLVERIFLELNDQYPSQCNNFSTYEELENLIFEALKQHTPNVRFSKLFLENIGHFSSLEIPFDKDLTCLIGENGTGKSTILRAIAIATIGHNHKKIEEKTKKDFLKIQDYSDGYLIYKDGIIRLEYTIDGEIYTNELKFSAKDDGRDVSIVQSGNFEIVYGKYNLKSLIVGFPQVRGDDSFSNSDFTSKITQPHINDLIPLINNSEDHRLQTFAGWIANLYFEAVKTKDKKGEVSKEEVIIDEAFEIISKITKKEIRFKTVKAIVPPEVWVTTYDSPNGIPLYLISQGFKVVIGWIGFFLQRFINTFPLSDPKSAFKENAILLLDEIDTSIHPVWQTALLDVLRSTFPNTQFILTTHSPLLVAGLNREQVVELMIQGNEVVALKNQTDTWALTYRDILQKLFDTTDPLPKKTIEELSEKLSKTTDENEIANLKEDIKRLEESDAFENDIVKYENQLNEKQKELDDLILKYKERLK
jgi:predicted ATP-binding protein involved in virulence